MAESPLIRGVYWGYNPLTNPLRTSSDIQVMGKSNEDPTKTSMLETTPKETVWFPENLYDIYIYYILIYGLFETYFLNI